MDKSLKNLERKAFQSFWDDGLLDTMVGAAITLIGFSWWQDMVALGAVFPALCVSMWYPLRRKLIEPRLGYVEFSGKRELKSRSFRFGMIVFMTGTIMFGAVMYLFWNSGAMPDLREMVAGFPAALIAMMAIPFAIFTGCRRFFAYAAIMLITGATTVLMDLRPGPPMLAGGMIIAVMGLALLLKFMADHPAESGTSA